MADQPLQPFSPPPSLLSFLPDGISAGSVVQWSLYIVFIFWAIYTVVAVYHWLRYSHASFVSFPAIGVHLLISFALMAYALSGTLLI
jgi:hypothetical protein